MKEELTVGNYKLEKTIGSGTFGKVKIAIHSITLEKVAVKVLEKNKIFQMEDIERVRREILFLKKLNHPNVIKLLEILEDSSSIYMVMEYAGGGELFNHIVKKKWLNESEASFFFYQIVEGIESIHKNGIVHRDLKPENLLFNEHKQLKIIDFGLSNNFVESGPLLKTPCGSPCYAAPEMVLGFEYSGVRVDAWSIGIILFAMTAGHLPFEDQSNEKLFRKIAKCNLKFPENVSRNSIEMIKLLLNTDPETRITIKEIKNHDYYLQGKTLYFKHMRNRFSEIYGGFKNIFVESLGDPSSNKNYYFNIRKQCEVLVRKFVLEKMTNDYKLKSSEIQSSIDFEKHNNITTTFNLLVNKYMSDNYLLEVLFEKEERKVKMDCEPSFSRKISGKINQLKLSISNTDSEEMINVEINEYTNSYFKKESLSKSDIKQSKIKSISKEISNIKQSMTSAYNESIICKASNEEPALTNQPISIIPKSKADNQSSVNKVSKPSYSSLNTDPDLPINKHSNLQINSGTNSNDKYQTDIGKCKKERITHHGNSPSEYGVRNSNFIEESKSKSGLSENNKMHPMDTIESSNNEYSRRKSKLNSTSYSKQGEIQIKGNSKKFVFQYSKEKGDQEKIITQLKKKAAHDPISHRENKSNPIGNVFRKEMKNEHLDYSNRNTIENDQLYLKTEGNDISSGFYNFKKKTPVGGFIESSRLASKIAASKQVKLEDPQASNIAIQKSINIDLLRQSYDSKLLKNFLSGAGKSMEKPVIISPRSINKTQISTITSIDPKHSMNKSERINTLPNEESNPQNLLKMNFNKQPRPNSKTMNPTLSQNSNKLKLNIQINKEKNQKNSKDKIRTISVINNNKFEDRGIENDFIININEKDPGKAICNLRLSQFNKPVQSNQHTHHSELGNMSIFQSSTPRETKFIMTTKASIIHAKSKSPPNSKPTLIESIKVKGIRRQKVNTIDHDSVASKLANIKTKPTNQGIFPRNTEKSKSIQELESRITSLKAKKINLP